MRMSKRLEKFVDAVVNKKMIPIISLKEAKKLDEEIKARRSHWYEQHDNGNPRFEGSWSGDGCDYVSFGYALFGSTDKEAELEFYEVAAALRRMMIDEDDLYEILDDPDKLKRFLSLDKMGFYKK